MSRISIMHRIPEVNHGQLSQYDLIQTGSVDVEFFSFFVVLIYDVFLYDVEEVGVGYAHEDFFYLFLGVEVSQTVGSVFIGSLVSKPQFVNMMTHVQHPCITASVR